MNAQGDPAPENIGLKFAFEIKALIGPSLDAGPGRNGHRRIHPILGGSVTGPMLNGQVLAGGADYELMRADGSSVVEAHYTLQASDGTPIYIVNKGIFSASPEVNARLDAGAAVDPSEYYFRAAPVFDARRSAMSPYSSSKRHRDPRSCCLTANR